MNDEWLAVITKLAGFRTAELLGPVVVGPLVEEGVKVAGVVLLGLAMPAGLSSPRAGFVLGALVGIGFGAVEDLRVHRARGGP